MRTPLSLLLALGCAGELPGPDSPEKLPSGASWSVTGSRPGTTVGTEPGVICAEPLLRAERAYDLYDDGADWSGQSAPVTSGDLLSGAGLAVADFDGDGGLDLFLPDVDGSRLFLSDGAGGWVNRTLSHLPTEDQDEGVGATAVDLDDDGDLDVYLARHLRPDLLLLNDGAGRFTVDPDYQPAPLRSVAATFGDVDGDGDLDAFVAHYGEEIQADTDEPNLVLRNDRGMLVDAGPLPEELSRGHTLVPGLLDLDDDGDLDLYAVNDFGWILPNAMGWGEGGGWTVGEGTGLSFATNGMALAVGDLNGDGLPDLGVTGINEYHLMLSQGPGLWADGSTVMGWTTSTPDTTWEVSWAAELADLDNDGDLDLYTARGGLETPVMTNPPPYLETDSVYLQEGGLFVDRAADLGLEATGMGRGAVLADLNGDGWLDVVLRDKRGQPQIWIARCGTESWLRLQLRQPRDNRFAVGAKVTVSAGEQQWTRWVHAGGTGFASGGPPEVHLGLGAHEQVDVQVRWPDGETSEYLEIPVRRVVRIDR